MSLTSINNLTYSSLMQSLDTSDKSSLKSDGSILNLVSDIVGTTSNSSSIQSIDISSYYKKLNSLGFEVSNENETTTETSTESGNTLQDILTNALKNDSLSTSQINSINKAMLSYQKNSSIISSTFELSV